MVLLHLERSELQSASFLGCVANTIFWKWREEAEKIRNR